MLLYVIGCDEIDFSNPDATVWLFEMNQWKSGAIPKTLMIFTEMIQENKTNSLFIREYMEEISVKS